MNHAITVELQFFMLSILWGAIILLAYDLLRIFRRLIKHNSFFLAIEDILFWVMASVFIFAMIYTENNGIIRGFAVMGMTIGMVLYHYIISDFLVNIITKLIRTLFKPFSIAYKFTKKFFLYIGKKVKKAFLFLLLRLKKISKSVKITINGKKQAKAEKHGKKKLEKKKKIEGKKRKKQSEKQQSGKHSKKKTGKKTKRQSQQELEHQPGKKAEMQPEKPFERKSEKQLVELTKVTKVKK